MFASFWDQGMFLFTIYSLFIGTILSIPICNENLLKHLHSLNGKKKPCSSLALYHVNLQPKSRPYPLNEHLRPPCCEATVQPTAPPQHPHQKLSELRYLKKWVYKIDPVIRKATKSIRSYGAPECFADQWSFTLHLHVHSRTENSWFKANKAQTSVLTDSIITAIIFLALDRIQQEYLVFSHRSIFNITSWEDSHTLHAEPKKSHGKIEYQIWRIL